MLLLSNTKSHTCYAMLGLLEFGHLTYEREKLINFLIKHKVLNDTIKCDKCGNDVNINKETLIY